MRPDEIELLEKLGECMRLHNALTQTHGADCGDFLHHIHALQNIVLARCGLRALEERLRKEKEEVK